MFFFIILKKGLQPPKQLLHYMSSRGQLGYMRKKTLVLAGGSPEGIPFRLFKSSVLSVAFGKKERERRELSAEISWRTSEAAEAGMDGKGGE